MLVEVYFKISLNRRFGAYWHLKKCCSFQSLQEYSAVQDKIYGALRNQNWGRLLSAVLVHGTA